MCLFLSARAGSKVLVLKTAPVLLENRLHVRSTNHSFNVKDGESVTFSLHRDTGFIIDVDVFNTHLTPRYVDYDGTSGSNNPTISSIPGFYYITSTFCRFPAQDYYLLNHKLHKQRQTRVKSHECRGQPYTCPEDMAIGEKYYYREVNESCRLATSNLICKPDAKNCHLLDSNNKLYCTQYISILKDLYGVDKQDFQDVTLYEFDSHLCKNAFISCNECRSKNCSQCINSDSCSCCYKDCLTACEVYYIFHCASKLKLNRCGTGDVSEFQLTPKYGGDMRLGFNCYLRHDPPASLYSVRYRVRYKTGKSFTSHWISKTQHEGEQQTNTFDSLEIIHSNNSINQYYMRAARNSVKDEFRYSVAQMGIRRNAFSKADGAKRIQPRQPFQFHVGDKSWKKKNTCFRLDDWQSMINSDFDDFRSLRVRHLGASKNGTFSYQVIDSLPKLQVKISKYESILKHIFNDSTIINDQSFQSKIERRNSSWIIELKGKLRNCPSVIGLVVIDEQDQAQLIRSDLLVLCPDKKFNMKVQIPRKGRDEREKLFTVLLSDSKQEYKLQVAVVDKMAKSRKRTFKETEKDTRRDPWIILAPLFATTGCVLVALVVILVYAQKTAKRPPKMELASASGWVWIEEDNKEPQDKDRLKRRHLILVFFVVIVRVLYSFIFTFSMAFAILTLLHGDNMKIIDDYRSFVQNKVSESSAITLRMDQFREQEIKSSADQSEDVQKACDFHLGLQLQKLQYNMSCTLQLNHMKMFNKISKKIIEKVSREVETLEQKLKHFIKRFSESTRRKLSNLKTDVGTYGRRVYDNKWFALPKGAYQISRGRKKREVTSQHNKGIDDQLRTLSRARVRRSFSGNTFIGFLDFVGVLDQEKLSSLEKNINDKIESMKASFDDFKQVIASGSPPFLPLTTGLLCPVRHLSKVAKQVLDIGLPRGLKGLCEKNPEKGLNNDNSCLKVNFTRFCSSKDDDDVVEKNQIIDSSSQRVYFEKKSSMDSEHNISMANKSSVLNSVQGNSHYNIEKGDTFEEQIETQKEENLVKQGKLKKLGSIYDAQIFITIRSVVLYVLATIDILLLVYRSLKTYQIVMKLLYGFEETVTHEPYEYHDPDIKEKAENVMRTIFDVIAMCFIKFIHLGKQLQKRVLTTNILPMLIVIALGTVSFYLFIVIAFNVMNVTVLEELGGYRMLSARLDADLKFTNGALADHIKFLNDHDMQVYKKSVQRKMHDYNKVLQDFASSEKQRFEDFNARFCSISNRSTCIPFLPDIPKVSFSSCIIPRFAAKTFEEYDGQEYRYKLKYESKKYVDAIRNIFLDTLYFIIGVILASGLIVVCTFIVFSFMKKKDMIRIRYIHIYPNLPPELVKEYEMEETGDETEQKTDSNVSVDASPKKRVKIPEAFISSSQDTQF